MIHYIEDTQLTNEIIKNDVERGMDYKPFVIIAKGHLLPKGHGDLKDHNDIINSLFDFINGKKTIGQCIYDAPTILEADKGDE